jgi:hypothetical protein
LQHIFASYPAFIETRIIIGAMLVYIPIVDPIIVDAQSGITAWFEKIVPPRVPPTIIGMSITAPIVINRAD